jgi:hypothetical protein
VGIVDGSAENCRNVIITVSSRKAISTWSFHQVLVTYVCFLLYELSENDPIPHWQII